MKHDRQEMVACNSQYPAINNLRPSFSYFSNDDLTMYYKFPIASPFSILQLFLSKVIVTITEARKVKEVMNYNSNEGYNRSNKYRSMFGIYPDEKNYQMHYLKK